VTVLGDVTNSLAPFVRGKTPIGVRSFRNEGMPFGIANIKSQIPDMKSEICHLKFQASAQIQDHTPIDSALSGFLVAVIF
jgi:hypothetical protein